MKPHYVGLVGDIGGTHARLALVDDTGHIRNPRTFMAREYDGLADVIAEYIETTAGRKRPPRAVIAAAGPVLDGEIEFTNLDWYVSEGDLLAHFEFEAVKLINDFAAQALACPLLEKDDLRTLGPAGKKGVHGAPCVVMGAGTGLGVAGLARSDRGDVAVSSEGGHTAFAPLDATEIEIWNRLHAKYGRVSNERVLSGAGMFDLYEALAEIESLPKVCKDQTEVMSHGLDGDELAGLTLDRFGAILGAVAGDLALTYGARGGVFVAGGIAPRMADRLAAGPFRERFEDKGRMADFVRDIPTQLVVHPYPAIVGAARELQLMERL